MYTNSLGCELPPFSDKHLIYPTWKVSVPEVGANPHFFGPEQKNRLFWKPCGARLSK